jgi:hypothetical protein
MDSTASPLTWSTYHPAHARTTSFAHRSVGKPFDSLQATTLHVHTKKLRRGDCSSRLVTLLWCRHLTPGCTSFSDQGTEYEWMLDLSAADWPSSVKRPIPLLR